MSTTIFVSAPGSINIPFELKSSVINYVMLNAIASQKYPKQIMNVNFRWCMPGEIEILDECDICSEGTYSLLWNSTKCLDCPGKASCQGKEISLNKGYWRMDTNSTDIVEWPNEDACLGGFHEENLHPIECEAGYEGILCNEWVIVGPIKYERISENVCSKCPDPAMNLLRIIGIAILLIVLLAILIM